ncbi:hypothetical protein JI66_03845 [Apilactobacillus kunkeei]|uniref:site-specific DNA-methyltransferase n=1 Tax=Apilactobacillus kunkeei TaxID=148814 RepID=UPI00050241DA|nr:site-specific DNA-methyltransferase [Apilactobacillus kunkeei]KFJ15240.1 hypothetical protein JI66_03845 [Apilactobacillus kunkeei]
MIKDNQNYNDNVEPNTEFLNELKNKLPEYFSKDGEFDIDKFKSNLKKNNINELKDGYQLDFIGKDYARRQSGERPTTVVVPDENQNNGDGKDSNNLFFTGDNLEVLRHLQGVYSNGIDVIYIDPPYNTGSKDFVYPDSFEYSDEKIKNIFNMDDEQLERLKSIQGKSSHSAWLTFMYPRLILAKRLLKDTGVIFISIDNNEQSALSQIMDEIFGEGNGIANIVRNTNSSKNNSRFISTSHDYCLVYTKNKIKLENKYVDSKWSVDKNNITEYENKIKSLLKLGVSKKQLTEELKLLTKYPRFIDFTNYWYVDERGVYEKSDLGGVKNGNLNPILNPLTNKEDPVPPGGFRFDKDTMEELKKNNLIHFHTDGSLPRLKRYLDDNRRQRPKAIMSDDQRPDDSMLNGFGTPFSNPKQLTFIERILSIFDNNSVVLDFFAGSSTTAHAVMDLNAKDNGTRKFIMVQLPEKLYREDSNGNKIPVNDDAKTAFNKGFKTIDELSRQRIRKASIKIANEFDLNEKNEFDGSFKHYRVVTPKESTIEKIEDFDPNKIDLFNNMVDSFSGESLGLDLNATGEDTEVSTWLLSDGYKLNSEIKDVNFNGYIGKVVNNETLYLVKEGWNSDNTKSLLNHLGEYELNVKSIIVFGYSFNIAEIKELEIGLKQLDMNVNLLKRY